MKRNQSGFTLIELMITVAIVGILAAVALPAYTDYMVKAKVSEIMLAASTCRTAVSEVYQTAEVTPGDNNWGCESASQTTKYVGSVSTDAIGVIVVAASDASDLPATVRGTTITLIPTDAAGAPLTTFTAGVNVGGFICKPNSVNGSVPMPAKYLPGSCRG